MKKIILISAIMFCFLAGFANSAPGYITEFNVNNSVTKAIISGATVRVWNQLTDITNNSNINGNCSFILIDNSYNYSVNKTGYTTFTDELTVSGGNGIQPVHLIPTTTTTLAPTTTTLIGSNIPVIDATPLSDLITQFIGIIPPVLYALIPVAIAIVVLTIIYKMGSFVNRVFDKIDIKR